MAGSCRLGNFFVSKSSTWKSHLLPITRWHFSNLLKLHRPVNVQMGETNAIRRDPLVTLISSSSAPLSFHNHRNYATTAATAQLEGERMRRRMIKCRKPGSFFLYASEISQITRHRQPQSDNSNEFHTSSLVGFALILHEKSIYHRSI